MQDPGAATLVLTVRDVDAALAGVKKNGGSVLSIGGEPMKIGGEASQSRSVFVRDPDGFMLELAGIQPAAEIHRARGQQHYRRTHRRDDQGYGSDHEVLSRRAGV